MPQALKSTNTFFDLKASTETVISDLNDNSAKVLDQEPIRVCKEEAPN